VPLFAPALAFVDLETTGTAAAGDAITEVGIVRVDAEGDVEVIEEAPVRQLFRKPMHPYTQALFSAIPVPDPTVKMNRIILEGSIPSPANPPKGCKFHTRCRECMEICKTVQPPKFEAGNDHYVVCHLYGK